MIVDEKMTAKMALSVLWIQTTQPNVIVRRDLKGIGVKLFKVRKWADRFDVIYFQIAGIS